MFNLFLPLHQEIMHALKMTYHVECFKCAACKTAIRNQAFYMEEGEPYCEKGKDLNCYRIHRLGHFCAFPVTVGRH